MEKDERIEKAAMVWAKADIFGEEEGMSRREALREYDVTEAEIRKYFKEQLDEFDPADEPWNSEDTKVLLGWLGAISVVIVVAFVVIVVL